MSTEIRKVADGLLPDCKMVGKTDRTTEAKGYMSGYLPSPLPLREGRLLFLMREGQGAERKESTKIRVKEIGQYGDSD